MAKKNDSAPEDSDQLIISQGEFEKLTDQEKNEFRAKGGTVSNQP